MKALLLCHATLAAAAPVSNPGPLRVLPAVRVACAMLLWCLPASAQVPYPQARVGGPVIDFQGQALTVSVPILGTAHHFNYRSDAAAPKWRWSVYLAYDPVAKTLALGDGRSRPASPAPARLAAGEVGIVARDGSEVYVFNQKGEHLRTLNTFTGALVYRFSRDAAGALTAIEDGDSNSTRIERDGKGLITAVVAPTGQRTTFSTDANGNPIRITDPAGEATSLSYSGDGQLVALKDPKGSEYQFTSDQSGHVTKLKDPGGSLVDLALISAGNGTKASWNSAMGRASSWLAKPQSDEEAAVVMTDPDGSEIRLQTGTDGSTRVAYPDGRTLSWTEQPDPRWGMQSPLLKTVALATPGGLTAALAMNRTVTLADPSDPLSATAVADTMRFNGRSYAGAYDAKSRQITWLTPAGRRSITTLDEHGRVTKIEMPGLLPIGLTYDGQGRLTAFTQGTGADVRSGGVSYDGQGRPAALTDPLKRTTRFEHDPVGRIIKQSLPDGRQISYAYDANGNRTSITPPGRPAHSFGYTRANLIESYRPPRVEGPVASGSTDSQHGIKAFWARLWSGLQGRFHRTRTASPPLVQQGPGETRYEYNGDGQLARILLPDRPATELAYDKGGRVSAVTGGGEGVRFGYDPKTAQLTTITAADGGGLAQSYDGPLLSRAAWTGTIQGTVSLTYDNDLRVKSTSVAGEPPIPLEYDPDGLVSRAGGLHLKHDDASGLLAATGLGGVTDSEEYNGFGEVTLARAAFKDREILADRYERDGLGRVVRKTETLEGKTTPYAYVYDGAGRLTDVTSNGAPTAHYEYDANGNRVGYVGANGAVKASYDTQDRLQQYGNAGYVSSANGEWLSLTVAGKTTTYTYDVFGNLKAASLPDGTKIDYVVDGANRRIGKKVNGQPVQGFLYQDRLKVIAELDGENQVVARFVYAGRSNAPDYMMKGGKAYRIVTDPMGSPRMVIDANTGEIAQRMDYDEFGNVLRDTKPGFQPFGFAGGIYDRHTGLTRFGARDYDAVTGRWTAKDAIWRPDTDGNLYSYVRNDPINLIDRDGADPSPVIKTVGIPATVYGVIQAVTTIMRTTALTGGSVFSGPEWIAMGGEAADAIIIDAPASLVWGAGGVGAGASSGAAAAGTAIGGVAAAGALGFGAAWGMMYNPWSDYIPAPGTGYTFGDLGRGQMGTDFGDMNFFGGSMADWFQRLMHPFTSPCGQGLKLSFFTGECGKATGDIHMSTIDGLRYDLQAAGEFVAQQDKAGRVKIQMRLEPDNSKRISYCTAVAALVDGAKVAIHLKPQTQLYVNGQATTLEPGRRMSLGKGGSIVFGDNSWVITWPDSTTAQIKPNAAHFDLLVGPGKSAGSLTGLLGNADGNPKGDLVARNGFVLAADFSSADLYRRFADSWRISQDESLFHYGKGESTATFTDRSVPRENVNVGNLDSAKRAGAERQCRAAGITAPGPLADCTLDLAVTGDRSFVSSAALAQATVRPGTTAGGPAGSLMVSGTGKQGYEVFDQAGTNRIAYERPTNSATDLPAGTYTVVLNASRQRVTLTPGQQAVVQAGSLVVAGTGKQGYEVYDEAGKERLTYERPTNSVTELLPGTYTVVLNASRQPVTVTPGQQAVVKAGSLMVSGAGKQGYEVYDDAGKTRLTYERPTNAVTELLPGTYTVVLNASRQRATVKPGEQAVVKAGSLVVSGAGKQGYEVFDETGKDRLTYERPTNSVTELLPGTYTVALNASRQQVAVTPGQQAVVQAGSLIVSGTGNQGYSVFDETGKDRLTYDRAPNSVTELLPGTYVVKVGNRTLKAVIKAGQRTTAGP